MPSTPTGVPDGVSATLPTAFPQPLEIHRAEGSIVEAVARLPRLAPDHPSVIGTHRTGEPHLMQGAHDREQIHVTQTRQVGTLVETSGRR